MYVLQHSLIRHATTVHGESCKCAAKRRALIPEPVSREALAARLRELAHIEGRKVTWAKCAPSLIEPGPESLKRLLQF